MPGVRTAVNKTHFLKNDDLASIVEPADPNEAAFTATKGPDGPPDTAHFI